MVRSRMCVCVLCAVLAAAIAALLWLAPQTSLADEPKPVSFISDVAPILNEHCIVCHDAKKRSGKLELTSYAKLRDAGVDPIVEGKPDESNLVKLLTSDGPQRMPPPPKDRASATDGALPPAKIAIIERWVREGARLDADVAPETDIVRELRRRWQPPAPLDAYPRPIPVTALAFSPDGQRLAIGGYHEVTIRSTADGKLLQRIRTRAERAFSMVFLPDGKLVVAGGRPGREGDLDVYDLAVPPATSKAGVAFLDARALVSHLLEADDCLMSVALSADGKSLAAGGCDRLIRVWDIAGGVAAAKLVHTIENHADWVLCVAFSPDGQRLFTAGRDKTAKVWDLVKKESLQTVPDHQQQVFGVTVRSDGKAGISVGGDRMLRIWSADGAGKPIKSTDGHTDEVFRVVPLPGQNQIATCSADKTVRIWKDDGTPLRTLFGLNDQVYSLAVSSDASLIAAGAWDGEVRIWKFADGSVVRGFNASPGYVKERVATDAK